MQKLSKRERLRTVVLPLMRCIRCSQTDLKLADATLTCVACGAVYRVHNDTPLMIDDPDAATAVDPAVIVENAYSEQWLELLQRAKTGPVLDLGSGNNPNDDDRLIKLDIFALPNVDVVGVAEKLPFRDGVFKLVMSGAVFEHVQDPFLSIAEVRRVLAENGDVYIETAFLQPVHAYPSHYFNMTRMGLDYVCRDFRKMHGGVQPHQYPSYALRWYLDVLASKLPFAAKHQFLRMTVAEILDEFEVNPRGDSLMQHLNDSDLEQLACGVYFYGRKTDAEAAVPALPRTLPSSRPLKWWRRLLRSWWVFRRACLGVALRVAAPFFDRKPKRG